MYHIKTHEYSLGELLSHSWELFKNHFWLFIALELVIAIPIGILIYLAPLGVVQVIGFVVYPVSIMAITYAVNKLLKGEKVTFEKAFNKSVSKLLWALLTAILVAILLIGLSFLLVVPAIIYGVYWMFILYAVVLRKKYGRQAMAYSKSIVTGRWWKVFWFVLVLFLLKMIISSLVWIPFVNLYPELITEIIITPYFALDMIINILGYLVYAFFEVVLAVFFINLDYTKKKT